jgi:predicted nucleic acid-binding Zn ribbon protein
MRMSGGGPTRVGDLLGAVLKQRGVDTQIRRVGALDAWADAVGKKIASVTNAKAVVASTLFVEVRSSAWLMELDFMKAALLEHVNERLEQDGAIERIVLTLMEGDGHPPTPITSER